MEAKEKLASYGLAALSDNELLSLIKFKGTMDDFYSSQLYIITKELERRKIAPFKTKIVSSVQVWDLFSFLEHEHSEQFWVSYLNRANKVIKTEFISKGGWSATVVDVKEIAIKAITNKACGVIMAHNHPSGEIQPSSHDNTLTRKVKEALLLLDICLLDHIIIGSNKKYYSFSDEGMI